MANPHRWKPRPGYVIVGFCWSFRHKSTGKIVRSKSGRPFPIFRRVA